MNSINDKLAVKSAKWYVISNILVKGVVFLTTPLFTRVLSVYEYGVVTLFVSWSTMLLPLFSLNLNYSIGRAKLDYRNDLDCYLGSMQLLTLVVSLVDLLIYFIFEQKFLSLLNLNKINARLLLIYLICQPVIVLTQNYYRYKYDYLKNIILAWVIVLGSTILSIILVCNAESQKDTYRIIGICIPVILLFLYFNLTALRGHLLKPNLRYWWYGLKMSLPLVVHSLSLCILAQADRVIIAKLCGELYAAIYSLAYSYGLLLSVISNAIADSWLPWFHDNFDAGNFTSISKIQKEMLKVGIVISLIAVFIGPEMIQLLGGKSYEESIVCIPPIVFGILFQYIYTHYVNIELHMKKTGYVSMATLFAACLNVVLNYVFIPRFGYAAAAYTTMACYLVLCLIHFCVSRFILNKKIYDNFFICFVLVAIILITPLVYYLYPLLPGRYALVAILLVYTCSVYKEKLIEFKRKTINDEK